MAGGLGFCGLSGIMLLVAGALLVSLMPSCDITFDFGLGLVSDCSSEAYPLHAAARDGDVERVRQALNAGADPDQLDGSSNSALGCLLALREEQTSSSFDNRGRWTDRRSVVVSMLLDAGADPDQISGAGRYAESPLNLALRRGLRDERTQLLDAGADPSLEDCQGVPLLAAGAPDAVDELLRRGADPNGTGLSSPVVEAAAAGNLDVLDRVLDAGADLQRPDTVHPGTTVGAQALVASLQQPWSPVAERLLDVVDPAGPEVRDRVLPAALGVPGRANLDAVLARGVDPDAGALTRAELAALIDRSGPRLDEVLTGSTVGTLPADGSTSHLLLDAMPADAMPVGATAPPTPAIPEHLRDCGADDRALPVVLAPLRSNRLAAVAADDATTRIAIPPLAVAVLVGDADAVASLLEHGADPNRVVLDRVTALELAAASCNPFVAGQLLAAGADPDLAPGGRSARAAACPAVTAVLPAG